MRIAFLGDGSLGHVRRWVEYFDNGGHDVILVSFEETGNCPFPAVRLRKLLPTNLAGYTASLGGIKSVLRSFRPDLVSALYISGYGFVAALSGFRPLVVSALGSDLLVDYPSSAIHRFQIRHAISRASLVTTDARVLTDLAVSIGARAENVVEACFGIDETIFYPAADQQADSSGPVIISTRNHYPVYDMGTLVGAIRTISDSRNARFVICGEGPERERLEAKVADIGMSGSVEFTGRLDPQGIASRLRSADVYVSTSRSDSTSVSLLEAMACGVVPVVTDIEANREWITHGINGFLFPAGDPAGLAECVRMALDPETAGRMMMSNFEIVGRRGLWRDNMKRVEDAFLGLLRACTGNDSQQRETIR
jgi:glycosyltransferase involved in cell wall biosynthesis